MMKRAGGWTKRAVMRGHISSCRKDPGLRSVAADFLMPIDIIILRVKSLCHFIRVRNCVKGIKLLDQKEEHPNPTGWMF
jgi:hypothetical protein